MSQSSFWWPVLIGGLLSATWFAFIPGEGQDEQLHEHEFNHSHTCSHALAELTRDLHSPYRDASGKPAAGSLSGNLAWVGHYDQCVALPRAKYCLLQITTKHNESIHVISWGVCSHISCTDTDLQKQSPLLFRVITGIDWLSVKDTSVNCARTPDKDNMYPITLYGCFLLVSLCIIGTLLDGTQHESRTKSLARYFSAWDVLSVPTEGGSLACLHGLRVLTMCWIVLGHTFLATFSSPMLDNPLVGADYVQSLLWQPIANAYFAVDNFFLLSGLLVAYCGLRELKKNNNQISLWKFYLHRYLRTTPLMAFMMLLWVVVVPHVGSGPLWYTMTDSPSCRQYWWSNLLHIQNFYPHSMDDICTGWVWFLALDTQFYFISPLILYLLIRSFRTGYIASIVIIGFSMWTTILLLMYYDINVNLTQSVITLNISAMHDFEDIVYGKPYCRISPYLIGMLLGYVIHNRGGKDQKSDTRKQPVSVSGWIIYFTAITILVWSFYPSFNGVSYGPWFHALYGSFSHLVWALAQAWLVYTCVSGNGGIINTFLSWPVWAPLSRLTFSVYLLHPFVLFIYFMGQHSPIHATTSFIIVTYLGSLFLSYIGAVILYSVVERPIRNLL